MKSAKSLAPKKKRLKRSAIEDNCLMGSTVLGERGQLVIPKDIRERLQLTSGAKFLIMNQPNGPIMIFPLDKMQSMLDVMTRHLTEALR